MKTERVTDEMKLRSALQAAVDTIQDYLSYTHDGDPWKEDARTMGEMDINAYGQDGRLAYALDLLAALPAASHREPHDDDSWAERDYQRGAEADFQSHVSQLKKTREWE